MPVLLIIKFVVSIIFYLFLILLLIEVIKVRLLNKQLNGIKDENEKDKTSKKIKKGKNMIKFLGFGIIFLFIISAITSGYLK